MTEVSEELPPCSTAIARARIRSPSPSPTPPIAPAARKERREKGPVARAAGRVRGRIPDFHARFSELGQRRRQRLEADDFHAVFGEPLRDGAAIEAAARGKCDRLALQVVDGSHGGPLR